MINKDSESMDFYKWVRCGEYKIENVNNKLYIRPLPESGYIRYDLTEKHRKKGSRKIEENNLVYSILNLNTSNNQEIINFVNTFGLLGLLPYKYLEPMYPPDAIDANVQSSFIPQRNGVKMLYPSDIENKYQFSFDNNFLGYKYLIHKISEPLNEFIQEVEKFQEVGEYISAINKCAKSNISGPLRSLLMKNEYYKEFASTDENSELIRKASLYVSFTANFGIQRNMVPGEQNIWAVKWNFISLLSAAYFFLSEYMLSNFWIGICTRCGTHYLSSVSSQGYCSRKCEDATRKAKSRKTKQEKTEDGG